MKGIRYAEGLKVLPILGPIAFTTSAIDTEPIDMNENHWATFLCSFGAMTSDSTDTVTVTVMCSSVETSATGNEVAFSYRLSAAVDTDTMGAITAATSDGVAITAEDDDKVLIIDVNPDALAHANSATDGRWVSLKFTPSAEMASGIVGVIAIGENRYPGNSIPSST
jgi:hypothetical protein